MADAPAAPPRSALTWTVYATIAVIVLVAAILVWQLTKLEPPRWCSTSTDAANAANRPATAIQACFELLKQDMAIYGRNTFALIGLLGLLVVPLGIVAVKARINVEGFGWHGQVEGDATPVVIKNPPTEPVPVADQEKP